ncbi:MAG: pyrroloquinoline quinone-dependent dehydrogenase [Gemmatimonadetes bacterium]|nr:pyrroloquinoline quinone-dependent dehydrogenase [Gemmatimonadota bacterium]
MSDPVTRSNAALEGRYRVEGRTLVRQLLRRSILCVGVFGVALPASPTFGQQGAQNGEWRSYGGDAGSTKYSPLDAIDETNVQNLEVVWRWESVDYRRQAEDPELTFNHVLLATPLKVGNALYTSTNLGQAAAINPVTGETLWVYNSVAEGTAVEQPRSTRGLAYWADGSEDRLFLVSGEHLVALGAQTGELYPEFGEDGKVDLRRDMGPRLEQYRWNAAPLVCGDMVIVGAALSDNPTRKEMTPGYVRGYDVITGQLRWRFNPVPQPGELGNETWEDGSWEYSGNANVWSLMSADEELGYVYLPVSTPTNDWYGGHRLGDNLFAESLVALECATGERVWHFQMVHHGLWDYDNPAAPNLVDITVDERPIKAVVQVSKQGFVYVFDRVTGEPVWPIEERAVPPSTVPGERASPTQPFPTRPAPFERQGITVDDLIDFTPQLRAEAIEILNGYVYGPMFTPPSVRSDNLDDTQGTVQLPGWVGGADWNGAAFDPETQILYVPSITAPIVAALVEPDPEVSNFTYVRGPPRSVVGPQGLPLVKPPWGRITAIDLNEGEHVWMVPNGEGPRDHEALQGLDLPRLGVPGRPAPLLTKTLLFIGEGSPNMVAMPRFGGGKMFRAYDKGTGEVLWEMELPAGTSGAPMTYMADGRQYVVVAVGDANHHAEFIALSLR